MNGMKSGEPNVGIRPRTAFALAFILSILSKESTFFPYWLLQGSKSVLQLT